MKKLIGSLIAFVFVFVFAVGTVSAAPQRPDTFTVTPEVRVVWSVPLPGPDFFVRLESEDGQTVINVVVDDPCWNELFVTLDALNTYQTFYTMPNIGGGPGGADQRYVMDSIPRLVVNNRVGLD